MGRATAEPIGELVAAIPDLPNRWGEGLLFAFSGMDGPTRTTSGFVASAAATPYGLLIHTPRRRILRIDCSGTMHVTVATGDVLVAADAQPVTSDVVESIPADLVAAYSAWHSLTGTAPRNAEVSLYFEDGELGRRDGNSTLTVDAEHGDAIALLCQGSRWALAYGASASEAQARAELALRQDLAEVVAQRLSFYRRLPAAAGRQMTNPLVDGVTEARLYNKCLSVMRVNTLAPEGVIRQHWSTPDRVPHRHMWLWDSVFHSFGMNHIDPELAWEFLAAVLERQLEGDPAISGMIPHCMRVGGINSTITQPPILAWGVWENYQALGDPERLTYALPRLEAYLTWNLTHRDANGNGLLEWFIEDSPDCRSGESGMDNSPRFDKAILVDAVDFSTFQALDMMAVAKIASTLGDEDKAALWRGRADEMTERIHADLWDAEQGFYCDREMDGTRSPVKAFSGFLPLLLNAMPQDRVLALIGHLQNPATFDAPFPVPSLSLDHPAWSTDMWRGATWINYDYLIIRGLLKQRRVAEAAALQARMLHMLAKYYALYAVLFEFYDAKDLVPPVACDRKGQHQEPYDIRVKMDSIRDYHWTAAVTAHLLSGSPDVFGADGGR